MVSHVFLPRWLQIKALRRGEKHGIPKLRAVCPFDPWRISRYSNNFYSSKHSTNVPQGGFALDLVKAFTLIPSQMAKRLLIHMGVPPSIIGFWIRSLKTWSVFFQLKAWSRPMPSTTGAPEGMPYLFVQCRCLFSQNVQLSCHSVYICG